jgi:hypothetical protein
LIFLSAPVQQYLPAHQAYSGSDFLNGATPPFMNNSNGLALVGSRGSLALSINQRLTLIAKANNVAHQQSLSKRSGHNA